MVNNQCISYGIGHVSATAEQMCAVRIRADALVIEQKRQSQENFSNASSKGIQKMDAGKEEDRQKSDVLGRHRPESTAQSHTVPTM